jgi:hypothetical protein
MLVAILGGGFEVKELKVPKVGRSSRMAACASGLLFIFLGIYLDRPAAATPGAAAAPQAQKSTEVASAALPQVVLVTALAGQPALRVDKIAAPAGSSAPASMQPRASAVPSQREAQETSAPQVRPCSTKGTSRTRATASSGTTAKRVPWEQKPRQWINRLKGKGDGR